MSKTLKQRIGALLIPKMPMTRENFDRLRLELNAWRVRMRNKFNPVARAKIKKTVAAGNLSVNIAAGPFGEAGWINLDLFKHPNIAFTCDCRKKLPFRNQSVARMRCEHVLEHFDIDDEVPLFLQECLRVLQPGGVVRFVVPDIRKFAEAYLSQSEEKWAELGFDLSNWPSAVYIMNHVFRQSGEHKFGYDFDALNEILLRFGFSDVRPQSWRQSVDKQLCNDQENHRPYSLYVDAVK